MAFVTKRDYDCATYCGEADVGEANPVGGCRGWGGVRAAGCGVLGDFGGSVQWGFIHLGRCDFEARIYAAEPYRPWREGQAVREWTWVCGRTAVVG
jgi:hypothetical protein